MGKGEHIHSTGFERGAHGMLLQTAALLTVTGLKALTCIDDGNAVGAFHQTATDGSVGCGSGRSRTKDVNIKRHANSPHD